MIRVPTLVLHRSGDRLVNVRSGRYLADHIEGARLVEVPGSDHVPWFQHPERYSEEIEEFLTGTRTAPAPERRLATVLFSDIVGSTERAESSGDAAWREQLDRHHRAVRAQLERFGGTEIKTLGDGFLAIFDGPTVAIRGATTIRDAVVGIGLAARVGLHCGEIEIIGNDIGGISVHIAARVGRLAGTGEVLVTRTVKDLVAGSGIEFEPPRHAPAQGRLRRLGALRGVVTTARFARHDVGLRSLLGRVGLADEPGDHVEAGVGQQFGDPIRRPAVCVERNGVAVGVLEMHAVVADLEREQQVAAGPERTVKLGEYSGRCSGGVWMMEYQARIPPRAPSARFRAVIVPTSNRISGWASRATATIAGDRSMPNVSTPSPCRYAVTRPGPQPTSATGPALPDSTSSANAPSSAWSNGFAASSSRNSAA